MKIFKIQLLLLLAVSNQVFSDPGPYFIMNFDNGLEPQVKVPLPIWELPSSFADNYGPNDFFEVTDSTSHSGTHSLRFTYEAKNDFCNTCGTKKVIHKSGVDNVDFFIADDNPAINKITDMTTQDDPNTTTPNDGPRAEPGRVVYNRTNGYSTWEIVSIESDTVINDKLVLKPLKPGVNGAPPAFNSGDEALIARRCGVDGTIAGGGQINRRSDCNNIIAWFITRSETTQGPGESIFRRQYLKPEVTNFTGLHQKLHYFRANDQGPDKNPAMLLADSRGDTEIRPYLEGFKRAGGAPIYKPGDGNGLPAGLQFYRSTWHYVEEEYQAATLNPNFDATIDPDLNPDDPNIQRYNADGAYRLWFSKSGEEDTVGATPTLEVTGLRFAPMNGGKGQHVSFWGNTQHNFHLRGSWYIDDVYIDNKKIGKYTGTPSSNNTAPPSFPTVTSN